MRQISTLWIIHRDSRQRAALARMAGAGDNTFLGGPSDELFASASAADVILLAPSGDFESELEFVHRFRARLTNCAWILLPTAGDLSETRRLFDNLPARFLLFPPNPEKLRRAIRDSATRRRSESLSRRQSRDVLAARFSRWFADLELPDLLQAVDPHLSHLPLLIRGETGTGRGLLARYVQAFGSSGEGALVHIPCRGITTESQLVELIEPSADDPNESRRTLWLEDADALPRPLQIRVRDWIQYGLPESALRTSNVRWVATAAGELEYDLDPDFGSPELDPSLEGALSGLTLGIPTLRERPGTVEPFVADSTLAWCTAQGERLRSFSEASLGELRSHPWPGNMAELEAVVLSTLAHSSANPLEPHHLRFQSDSRVSDPASLPMAEFIDEPTESQGTSEAIPVPPADPIEQRNGERVDERNEAFPDPSGEGAAEASRVRATPEPITPVVDAEEATGLDEAGLRRLVTALAHEVRNPLVSIRTFSELLPSNFEDEEFRLRFSELVGADIRKIESVLEKLGALANMAPARREPVDLSKLLDELLDQQLDLIRDRRLLVLKELDRSQPYVLSDPDQLRRAYGGLLSKALSMAPIGGDVYLASNHNRSRLTGAPTIRTLLRYHNGSRGSAIPDDEIGDNSIRIEGVSPTETALEFLITEAIIRAQGGSMTLDTTHAQETVIILDLPAPRDY